MFRVNCVNCGAEGFLDNDKDRSVKTSGDIDVSYQDHGETVIIQCEVCKSYTEL